MLSCGLEVNKVIVTKLTYLAKSDIVFKEKQ